jgi:hypothetical protein
MVKYRSLRFCAAEQFGFGGPLRPVEVPSVDGMRWIAVYAACIEDQTSGVGLL